MVVAVHESRADDMPAGPDDDLMLAATTQLLEVVDGENDAVPLQDRSVLEDIGTTLRIDAADDRPTMNKTGNQLTDPSYWGTPTWERLLGNAYWGAPTWRA